MKPQITTVNHKTNIEEIRDMTDEEIADICVTFPNAYEETEPE